mmetsp:Transcript_21131/g.28392  ORF Transcript_21131/g.28392 Transcript_21131/m.28392 type:complete len:114 (+) Transcript_21131:659-1000(+)
MIFMSFKKAWPYLLIFLMGATCFTGAFTALTYQRQSEEDLAQIEELHSWQDYYHYATRPYVEMWHRVFTGTMVGLEMTVAKGFDDNAMVLFYVCIILSTLVLTNLLIAVVGAV